MDDERRGLVVVTPATTERALVLRVSGTLDLVTAHGAALRLREMVAALPPPSLVVLDLTTVEFLSAAGLRTVRELAAACADKQVSVRLASGPGSVARRILTIARFDEDVPTFDDVPAALGTE
jgi:anti-anti-sigma factor